MLAKNKIFKVILISVINEAQSGFINQILSATWCWARTDLVFFNLLPNFYVHKVKTIIFNQLADNMTLFRKDSSQVPQAFNILRIIY